MTTTTSNLPTLPALSSLLDDVASAIARDGIERHEHDVARVAAAFGAAGRAGPCSTWCSTGPSRPSPASAPSAASRPISGRVGARPIAA